MFSVFSFPSLVLCLEPHLHCYILSDASFISDKLFVSAVHSSEVILFVIKLIKKTDPSSPLLWLTDGLNLRCPLLQTTILKHNFSRFVISFSFRQNKSNKEK